MKSMAPNNVIISIPEKVSYILNQLREHRFEAYAVGGCVRDSVLGRIPMDWDITTSARPEEVKRIFRRTIDTGIAHGTVTVMLEGEGFEVTTYRVDGKYEDHRHPDKVEFTPNLEEDLKRRDFTINAMAYSPEAGIVDLFGGMEDIRRGCIRCVGDPVERFTEDALRMLRGIRFAGQLGFGIEAGTLAAIQKCAATIGNVSVERIQVELTKLLVSDGPEKLIIAEETGLCRVFLPEFSEMLRTEQNNPHHCFNVGEHALHAVKNIQQIYRKRHEEDGPNGIFTEWDGKRSGGAAEYKSRVMLAYAALLHDVGKPAYRKTDENGIDHFHGHDTAGSEMAHRILRRLRFDNDTVHMVSKLIRFHERRYDGSRRALRRMVSQAGTEAMPYLFVLQEADVWAQSGYQREEKLARIHEGRRMFFEIRENEEAVSVRELAVTGTDLMEAGVRPGPQVGEMLRELLQIVLDEPEKNSRKLLLTEVRKRIKIENE